MSWLLWALLAVPLGAGTLLAWGGRRTDRVAGPLGVAAAVAVLGLAVAAAVARPRGSMPLLDGIRAGAGVDGLSAVMVVTVAAVTLAVLVFTAGETDLARGRFVGLMLLFAGAMLVTVTATTLPLLLMAWEAMGATSWALIGFWWRQPERVSAATTAFLTTRAADLGLYLAAGAALAGGVGSLRLDALPRAAAPWLTVVTAGVVASAVGKSAQLPFSFWLSRAMQGPSPVSALLHSATMVAAGAYLLLRLHPLLAASAWAGPTVAWIGAATALLLGLVALAQTDLKQLLAASTCAHIGFMALAAGVGGTAAGTFELVAHAATKSLLFLCAGVWLAALGTKQLTALRAAARRYRLIGVTFTVGILCVAGLPPLSLWAADDEVLAAALRAGAGLYAVGLVAAVLSAGYSVKAAWYVLAPAPVAAPTGADPEHPGPRHDPTVAAVTALVPLTVAAALLGVLALPGPSGLFRQALGDTGTPSPVGWQLALSAAVAVAATAVTWRWAGRPGRIPDGVRGWLLRWLDLQRAARLLVAVPTLALAHTFASFDDRIVDGAVRRLGWGVVRVARLAGRVDDVGVDGAIAAIAAATRRLGALARRPQTGLLHQYYAQAALALAALAALLLIVR